MHQFCAALGLPLHKEWGENPVHCIMWDCTFSAAKDDDKLTFTQTQTHRAHHPAPNLRSQAVEIKFITATWFIKLQSQCYKTLVNVHFANAKVNARDRKKRPSSLKVFRGVALSMRSETQAREENKDPFYLALYTMLFFFWRGIIWTRNLLTVCTQTLHFIGSTPSVYSFNGNGFVTSPLPQQKFRESTDQYQLARGCCVCYERLSEQAENPHGNAIDRIALISLWGSGSTGATHPLN